MKAKALLWTLGKYLIGGLTFAAGSMLGGMAAGSLGIPLPIMPAEIDPARVGQMLPLVGLLMAGVLSILSKNSAVRFLPRWIILSLFSWTVYVLNTYLEAKFFSPSMATSYVLVMNLIACLSVSAVVAWLFKPSSAAEPFWAKARTFFAARPLGSWSWRCLGALASFPMIYFLCGWIVAPFVISYYQQQYAGLALPTQGVMLVLATTRSLFFILSILPLLIAWKGSRTSLFLGLGMALFMLVGGLNMLQAVWLPWSLRGAHSLEMLADSFVHAAALVFLLVPAARAISQIQLAGRRLEAG